MQRLIVETENAKDLDLLLGLTERMGLTTVSPSVLEVLFDAEVKKEIAVLLFKLERFTLGQASIFAEVDQIEMQLILKDRGIPLHYDDDEFEAGLNGLDLL